MTVTTTVDPCGCSHHHTGLCDRPGCGCTTPHPLETRPRPDLEDQFRARLGDLIDGDPRRRVEGQTPVLAFDLTGTPWIEIGDLGSWEHHYVMADDDTVQVLAWAMYGLVRVELSWQTPLTPDLADTGMVHGLPSPAVLRERGWDAE